MEIQKTTHEVWQLPVRLNPGGGIVEIFPHVDEAQTEVCQFVDNFVFRGSLKYAGIVRKKTRTTSYLFVDQTSNLAVRFCGTSMDLLFRELSAGTVTYNAKTNCFEGLFTFINRVNWIFCTPLSLAEAASMGLAV